MTFNSSQQERLLTALERIADALEKQTRPAEEQASPAQFMQVREQVLNSTGYLPLPTDPHSTKGPYR